MTMHNEHQKPSGQTPGAYAWYALALLTLVYVLNFLDRTLIYILFTPIKKEMAFTDLQLALLGTTSFVIFYTVLGIPFGRLADRAVRKNMIAGGLAVWSLFSGLTGFAGSFRTLFLCRVMVGVGEATLGPAALSLLSDYFPPRRRATVQAIYSSGIAVGAGLAFFLGGWAADRFRRFGRGGRMLFSSVAALIAVPFWVMLIFSNNIGLLLLANFVLLGLSLMWLGPAAADVHDIAGPHLRGLGIGIY